MTLIRKIEQAKFKYDLQEVESLLKLELETSNDKGEIYLQLALTNITVPMVDYIGSLKYLEMAKRYSNYKVKAIILKACIEYFNIAGVEENTLFELKELIEQSKCYKYMSIYYIISSWARCPLETISIKDDMEKCISLDHNIAYPYLKLADIYMENGNVCLSNKYREIGKSKIIKVLSESDFLDFTLFENYINEHVYRTIITSILYKEL